MTVIAIIFYGILALATLLLFIGCLYGALANAKQVVGYNNDLKDNPNLFYDYINELELKYPHSLIAYNKHNSDIMYGHLSNFKCMLLYLNYKGLLRVDVNNLYIDKNYNNALSKLDAQTVYNWSKYTQVGENENYYIISAQALMNLLGNNQFIIENGSNLANKYKFTLPQDPDMEKKIEFIQWYSNKHIKRNGKHLKLLSDAVYLKLTLADTLARTMEHSALHNHREDFRTMWKEECDKLAELNAITIPDILNFLVDARFEKYVDHTTPMDYMIRYN